MGSSKSKFVDLATNYDSKKTKIEKKIQKIKKKELERKKIKNKEKEEKEEKKSKNSKKNIEKNKLNHISETKIEEFIESVLKNENINIDYLPDVVEKQIYKNVLLLLFNLIDKSVDKLSIQFIGHEIKLVIQPIE